MTIKFCLKTIPPLEEVVLRKKIRNILLIFEPTQGKGKDEDEDQVKVKMSIWD